MSKLSLDITPMVSPELQLLRDSIELNNRKLEAFMLNNTVQTGTLIGVPTDTLPTGYMWCDGSTFSAANYPDLAAYLGGNTLPDYRGRVLVGKDGTQTEFDVIGETGGAKTVTLIASETPNHGHTTNQTAAGAVTLGHSGHGDTGDTEPGNHAHAVPFPAVEDSGGDLGGSNRWRGAVGAGSSYSLPHTAGVDAPLNHHHTGPGAHSDHGIGDHGHSVSINATSGGGAAHQNLQPYKVVNWAIKY